MLAIRTACAVERSSSQNHNNEMEYEDWFDIAPNYDGEKVVKLGIVYLICKELRDSSGICMKLIKVGDVHIVNQLSKSQVIRVSAAATTSLAGIVLPAFNIRSAAAEVLRCCKNFYLYSL
ncbi:hypothetical protein Tco_1221350 [Tanacetum coccineum]